LDAIERRDQHAAHSEMKKHIGSVSGRLFGEF
jgi:DNA-binding GntR family transcriptional regulator